MEMKRLISIAIAFAMLAVSFAMVTPQRAEAAFIETGMVVPWPATFTPNDVVWDNTGKYCLIVGTETDMIAPGLSNAWHYDSYTDIWVPVTGAPRAQKLTSACWDNGGELFWAVGDLGGSALSTVYDMPRNAVNFVTPSPTLAISLNAVAADLAGNLLVGGAGGYMQAFNKLDNLWYDHTPGPLWLTKGITFNQLDGRFIVAASDGTQTGILYTDASPLGVATLSHVGTLSNPINDLKSIAWNPVAGYALAVGSGVFKIKYDTLPMIFVTSIVADGSGNLYNDVAWDTDGYIEAAIVGQNNVPRGTYWRFYTTNPTMIPGFTEAALSTYTCVSIKPPASPKVVFIPIPAGGVVANIQEFDQGTRLTANAVIPKLYWIDLRDNGGISRLEQQVDVDANYWFVFEYNYSLGFTAVEFVIQAWHDRGAIGAASVYPAEDAANRNLAFTITADDTAAITAVTYPAPNLEIQTGVGTSTFVSQPVPGDALQDIYRIAIPVWLGNQVRSADGTNFASGDVAYSKDKTLSLLDANSWDFSVTVRDATSGGYNVSYAEFGIKQAVSIQASGNPTGNAPPGTVDNPMGPNSAIVYSANTNYYVDVAIPHLYKNGVVGATDFISAINVDVQNTNVDAAGFSDIAAQIAFTGPNAPFYVWGAVGVPMAPLNNGLVSAGPTASDHTLPGAHTQLAWWVTVPGATPEGVYWGVITVTIVIG